MPLKKSQQQKERDEKLDRIIAQFAWIVIFVYIAGLFIYVNKAHPSPEFIFISIFVPTIAAVIWFTFNSPREKQQIILHLIQEWKLAVGLLVFLVIGATAFWLTTQDNPPLPSKKIIEIGVSVPTTGSNRINGEAVLHGVELAVKEEKKITADNQNYELKITHMNDVIDNNFGLSNSDKGASNAEFFLDDPEVAGIIAPFDSSVAVKQIPIINGSNNVGGKRIAMISPSATADCLTTTTNPTPDCNNLNNSGSFFRMAALNTDMGKVFADCLSPAVSSADLCRGGDLHKYKKVAIIYDGTVYSKGFAESFRTAWDAKKDKATESIVKEVANDASSQSLEATLQEIHQDLHVTPDLVFFAGSAKNATTLYTTMKVPNKVPDFSKTPFAAGGAIMNEDFVKQLKNSSAPVFVAVPIKALVFTDDADQKSGTDFITNYKRAYNKRHTPYSAAGYDATKILIKAIRNATNVAGGVPDTTDTEAIQDYRDKIIENIKAKPISDNEKGITGHYSFFRKDNGDFDDAAVSVFQWNQSIKDWDYQ